MPSKKFCALFGGPPRTAESVLLPRHKDIAAALQETLEQAVFALLRYAHKKSGCDALVLGGGVALNSVQNGKILQNTPFKRIWIHPNATDGGSAVGAALYWYNTVLGNPRTFIFKDAFLGPRYSDEEIERFLRARSAVFHRFEHGEELARKTAQLIFNNRVVGWFQGGMEWGARAGRTQYFIQPMQSGYEGDTECEGEAPRILPAVCPCGVS